MEGSNPGVSQDASQPPTYIALDGSERDPRIGAARKWLIAISIITLVSGFIFWALAKDRVEQDIRDVELELVNVDNAARDALFQQETGMSWEQTKAHQRVLVTVFLFINIGLSIAYFGMWFWAKRNPFAATVSALLLFVTVFVANAIYEPETIRQGIVVKIFFVVAIVKAIAAAHEERRLQAHVPRATVT